MSVTFFKSLTVLIKWKEIRKKKSNSHLVMLGFCSHWRLLCSSFNPFHSTGPFLYPLRIEDLCFCNNFKRYRKRPVTWNALRREKLELLWNINPLSANITKWSNSLKQFVGKLPTNCLSVWPFCGIGSERVKWDKVFKNGPNKNSGRQPLKNLKGYGMLLWNYGIHSWILCPKYSLQN